MTQRPRRDLPYAAFTRHLVRPENTPPRAPEPTPQPPHERVIEETKALLARVDDELVNAQAQILAHMPEAVRLKLSRLVLAAAERVDAALVAVANVERYGSIAPPRGAKPRKKKPRPKL